MQLIEVPEKQEELRVFKETMYENFLEFFKPPNIRSRKSNKYETH